ncbi:MAG: hypothetical protein FJX77_17980, partial [Armatimonadetes bacterium]|nr:hypothetical protein [Armatimonadota bacterium]
ARALAAGQVGHAYLFLGAARAGKHTAARLFATAIQCERQPAVRGAAEAGVGARLRLAPCGACESCRRIQAGTHPEVMEIRPDSPSGSNVTIDQARLICANAALRPKLGTHRIYLFPAAEALTEDAANALLKTLEEPSLSVVLLLCAPHPGLILPTVRSRCQPIRFGLSPLVEVEQALREAGAELEQAQALAAACGGLPGVALEWYRRPEVLEARRNLIELFLEALELRSEAPGQPWNAIRALGLSERLRGLVAREEKPRSKGSGRGRRPTPEPAAGPPPDAPARPARLQHRDQLDVALGLLRDGLVLTQGGQPELVQNRDYQEALEGLARRWPAPTILEAVEAVLEASQLLDRNVNPALVLDRMFWNWICGPAPRLGGGAESVRLRRHT